MTTRNTYTAAFTPQNANFPISHTPVLSGLNPSSSRLHSEPEHESTTSSIREERSFPSRTNSWLASAKDMVQMNKGLLLFMASQLFYTFTSLAVKILNSMDPPITVLELIAIRTIITYVCCVTYMILTNIPDPILGPKGVRRLMLLRGFTGFFSVFGLYYSLQYLSLSDATVLTFLAPMCTAMAGALFLGENFARQEAYAGFVSLVGVVLIARPTAIFGFASRTDPPVTEPTSPVEKGTQAERLIAVGIALIGVLGSSGAYTTIRAIGKRAHPLQSMVFQSSTCIVASIVGMTLTKTPVIIPTRIDWLTLLLLVGIFGFTAQLLLTMALQRETAGRGSIAIYIQIVFTTILEKIVFNTVPSALSITGTLLIIASAIYVVLTKEKEDSTPTRKDIDLRVVHLSQDAELEEGLLDSQWGDGDKLP